MENFKWTDELVAKYARFISDKKNHSDVWTSDLQAEISYLSEFKLLFKPEYLKEQPKYPEGILSIKTYVDNQIFHFENHRSLNYQDWCSLHLGGVVPDTIHSVKNSKGIVFTLGDMANDEGRNFEIVEFSAEKSEGRFLPAIMVSGKDKLNRVNVDCLTKAEPKKPLFKTEDGEDVFEKDQYFQIHEDVSGYVVANAFSTATYYIDNPAIRFKERANADKYVSENRKSISYKELEDYVQRHYSMFTKYSADIILNHFKPKQ